MASQTATLAAPQQYGPMASAVKWAFKSYFQARQAIDDVVAEARAEWSASAPIAGGSAGDEDALDSGAATVATGTAPAAEPRARWMSADGVVEYPIEEVGSLLTREDGFAWLDIPALDAPTERILAEVFKFHPLAIRDCREPGHMPKVHIYDDHLFVVLLAPERDATGLVQHRELNQFVGARYLVTVHEPLGTRQRDADVLETSAVLDRVEAGRARPGTPAELSYAIVTRLAVGMESLVADLASGVATLERAVSSHERHLLQRPKDNQTGNPESIIDEMFEMRHALLAIETIADQNRVVYARAAALARSMPRDERRLIEDVEDQFNRVRRLCRGQKELLQGVLDFSRTRTSAKMDLAMSRIALLSAVALPISIISSIYGMQLWVFTTTRLDILAMVLAVMGVLTFGMLHWARSQGWW